MQNKSKMFVLLTIPTEVITDCGTENSDNFSGGFVIRINLIYSFHIIKFLPTLSNLSTVESLIFDTQNALKAEENQILKDPRKIIPA